MGWYSGYGNQRWRPYVPVAKRKAQAASHATKLAKKEGRTLSPVKIEGRKIAKTFWGQAWCTNLESYSDYANRLPRGGRYVRNGSVIDLQIQPGLITSLVSGSEIYTIKITIQKLAKPSWERIKQDCSRSITSLIDLLQGRLADGIMQRLTQREDGLFPRPKEIKMSCSCPDYAGVCKHIAATMYGVGSRLDSAPELLFTLRGVDHLELISQAVKDENLNETLTAGQDNSLGDSDLGALFGIELDVPESPPAKTPVRRAKPAKPAKAVRSTVTATRATQKTRKVSAPKAKSTTRRTAK